MTPLIFGPEKILGPKRFLLIILGVFQDGSAKVSRFFMSCFGVTPEFAVNFKFQKSKGQGEFAIKYMLAAFNKEAESGEFFIEFEEKVWEHKLIKSFQSQGACQVTTITFANNDGGESAVNALARIITSQKKSGEGYTRGTCTPALYAKLHAKMEEAHRKEQLGAKEFDEKTSAAIKLSLEEHTVKLESIGNNVQSNTVELEVIKGDVQSQAVELVHIKQGVENVIPVLQGEIKDLKEALSKSNAARDTTEGKLGHKTRIINQQDAYIMKLEEEQVLLVREKQAWIHEKNKLLNQNMALQAELDQIRDLRQILDKADHVAGILSSTLAEERAAKRPRAEA